MQIHSDIIKEIRRKTDIVSLIRNYIPLHITGKNYKGLCPFHSEKTPSLIVSSEFQNYKCYGCNKSGDIYNFIQEIEEFNFIEAAHFLAAKADISLSPLQSEEDTAWNQCMQMILYFYRSVLSHSNSSTPIQKYLQHRKVGSKIMNAFQLGYTGTKRQVLLDFLKMKKIDILVQISTGMIGQNENGKYYERMHQRLIFPLIDRHGRIVGFAGRTILENKSSYINPPETALYKKHNFLYGLYEATHTIRKNKRVIIVEGYLDVIRLHNEGWQETVAVCGTAFTVAHTRLLKLSNANEFYFCFDGDQAGENAMIKAVILCIYHNISAKVIQLPKGIDPDSFFNKHDHATFEKYIQSALGDFDFLLYSLYPKEGSLKEQEKIMNKLINLLNKVGNPLKKNSYIESLALTFKIDKRIILDSLYSNSSKVKVVAKTPESGRQPTYPKEELFLIQYLLTYPRAISYVREKITSQIFSHTLLGELYLNLTQLDDTDLSCIQPSELPNIFINYKELIFFIIHTNEPSRFTIGIPEYNPEKMNHLIKVFLSRYLSYTYRLLDKITDNTKKVSIQQSIQTHTTIWQEL